MNAPIHHFALLTEEMIELVRTWRNKARIRNNMLSNTEITIDQQVKWFADLENDQSRKYFVLFQNMKPIGMLYFSEINDKSCHWGCYIGEETIWPGSGLILEVAALDFAFNYFAVNSLIAEVLEFNFGAINMLKFFGYTFDSTFDTKIIRDVKKIALLRYDYCKEDWVANRNIVITKLPKQIRTAINNVILYK